VPAPRRVEAQSVAIITSLVAEDRLIAASRFEMGALRTLESRICGVASVRCLAVWHEASDTLSWWPVWCKADRRGHRSAWPSKGGIDAWKRIAAIAAIVFIGGAFLAGYLPEHRLRIAAEQQSLTLRGQLAAAEARVRMGQLLGQALAVREVVIRQNYGQAQELSSAFFDSVRREAAATTIEEFRAVLNEVLSRRDAVTASLTKADPGSADALYTIEVQLRQALGYPLPHQATAV
jgi:hypothetical protein